MRGRRSGGRRSGRRRSGRRRSGGRPGPLRTLHSGCGAPTRTCPDHTAAPAAGLAIAGVTAGGGWDTCDEREPPQRRTSAPSTTCRQYFPTVRFRRVRNEPLPRARRRRSEDDGATPALEHPPFAGRARRRRRPRRYRRPRAVPPPAPPLAPPAVGVPPPTSAAAAPGSADEAGRLAEETAQQLTVI